MTPPTPRRLRANRKTIRLLRVLLYLHDARQHSKPNREASPRELMEKAELSVRAFYDLINRLEGNGLVEGEFEVLPEGVHRPRHIFYRLTKSGVPRAAEMVVKHDRRWRRFRKG